MFDLHENAPDKQDPGADAANECIEQESLELKQSARRRILTAKGGSKDLVLEVISSSDERYTPERRQASGRVNKNSGITINQVFKAPGTPEPTHMIPLSGETSLSWWLLRSVHDICRLSQTLALCTAAGRLKF